MKHSFFSIPKLLSFLVIATTGSALSQGTAFLDPIYDVVDLGPDKKLIDGSPNKDIVYWEDAPINQNPDNPTASQTTLDLHLDLYHPAIENVTTDSLPGLVIIHGGGWSTGAKDDAGIREVAIHYAKCGYIVASIQYRLNRFLTPSYGPNARNPGYAIESAVKAINWMIDDPMLHGKTSALDINRIIIGGGSAGACTSIMQGYANNTGARPKVILDFWGFFFNNPTATTARPDISWGESPIRIDPSDPPIFTVHGTEDTFVGFNETIYLSNQLSANNIDHKLFVIAKAGHSLWNELTAVKVDDKTLMEHSVAFCYKHLYPLEDSPHSTIDTLQENTLRFNYDSNRMVIHWKGLPGKRYDLLSTDQLEINPVSSWPIYQAPMLADRDPKGPFIVPFSDIPSGGDCIIVMSETAPNLGTKKFFAVKEKPAAE